MKLLWIIIEGSEGTDLVIKLLNSPDTIKKWEYSETVGETHLVLQYG
jgi:hypothetical protein